MMISDLAIVERDDVDGCYDVIAPNGRVLGCISKLYRRKNNKVNETPEVSWMVDSDHIFTRIGDAAMYLKSIR